MPEPEQSPAPSFEESLAELQRIVTDLEDGSVGLEESMRRFEQGVRLIRECYKVLEQAEQKIEILTRVDASGNPVVAPFDATATYDNPAQSPGRRRAKTKVKAVETTIKVEQVEDSSDEDEPGPRLF